MKQAKIFAHRGASGYAPENTLEAFALAQQQGADGIELDVQLSKDGVPVVFHDESLKRVSGHAGMIKDFTLEELKRIPVSNGFAQYPEARIPTLEEALNLVKPGSMEINIELKTGIFWYPEIEEKTAGAGGGNRLPAGRRDPPCGGICPRFRRQGTASGAVPRPYGGSAGRILRQRSGGAGVDRQ